VFGWFFFLDLSLNFTYQDVVYFVYSRRIVVWLFLPSARVCVKSNVMYTDGVKLRISVCVFFSCLFLIVE
jgi:hypothetical protein